MNSFKILALSILCVTLVSEYSCAIQHRNKIVSEQNNTNEKIIVQMLLNKIFDNYYGKMQREELLKYAESIIDCLRCAMQYDQNSFTYLFIKPDNQNELQKYSEFDWIVAEDLYYDEILRTVREQYTYTANDSDDKLAQLNLLTKICRYLNNITYGNISEYYDQYLSNLQQPDINLDNTNQSGTDSSDTGSNGFYQFDMN